MSGEITLENPFINKEKHTGKDEGGATAASASSTDLIRVVRSAKSGDFEIAHGTINEEETSLNRVWRVVSNKNEQLQQQA